MKIALALCVCGLVAWVAAVRLASSAEPKSAVPEPTPGGAPAAVAAEPEVAMAAGDKTSDLVATFYKVLLQKKEPTLQQEKDLFGLESSLRINLLARKKGAETDPVVLNLFRQHRDLFLPLGKWSDEQYAVAIQITSPFVFVRSLARPKVKAPEGSCYVMAMFVHDPRPDRPKNVPPRHRTIIFGIDEGKIDPYEIYMDGFEGEMTGVKFTERVPGK
jgi:hypothetical protein